MIHHFSYWLKSLMQISASQILISQSTSFASKMVDDLSETSSLLHQAILLMKVNSDLLKLLLLLLFFTGFFFGFHLSSSISHSLYKLNWCTHAVGCYMCSYPGRFSTIRNSWQFYRKTGWLCMHVIVVLSLSCLVCSFSCVWMSFTSYLMTMLTCTHHCLMLIHTPCPMLNSILCTHFV